MSTLGSLISTIRFTHPKVRLFDQIEEKMRLFVADFLNVSLDEADVLREQYWRSHGTTLAGMMNQHAMPPEAFLQFVHDIDFSPIPHSKELSSLISALPGRKIVLYQWHRTLCTPSIARAWLGAKF
jgi:putative hydrolase of the HAD superfamily